LATKRIVRRQKPSKRVKIVTRKPGKRPPKKPKKVKVPKPPPEESETEEEPEEEPEEPDEPETPASIETTGWKRRLETKHRRSGKILRPKSELWDRRRDQQVHNAERGVKRLKGIIVQGDGLTKTGKTTFVHSASEFAGYAGKRREIPAGLPIYLIETEPGASKDIAETEYGDLYDAGHIVIIDATVDPETITDENPQGDEWKTQQEFVNYVYELMKSLEKEKCGTIAVDNWTDVVEAVNFALLEHLGIGLKSDGSPTRKPQPHEYGWRNRWNKKMLKTLRKMIINVVLISQVKEEIERTGDKAFDLKYTGDLVAVGAKGQAYWADFIVRFEKVTDTLGNFSRAMVIRDSRFEGEGRIVIEDDTSFDALVGAIKHKLDR